MNQLDMVFALLRKLNALGKFEAERAVLRDLRDLLNNHFPLGLNLVEERLGDSYAELVSRTLRSQTSQMHDDDMSHGRARGHSDPTADAARLEMQLLSVNNSLQSVYERHRERLTVPTRHVHIWRDEEAADAILNGWLAAQQQPVQEPSTAGDDGHVGADEYTTSTNAETRARYGQ